MANRICDDMIAEILLRVPAMSLLRFKCVSRKWLKIIASPSFIIKHASRPPCSVSGFYILPHYFYVNDYKQVPLHANNNHIGCPPSLLFLDNIGNTSSSFRIRDSRNGLILCIHRCVPDFTFSVCNPTTQIYTPIPDPPRSDHLYAVKHVVLGFDPTKSLDYKVVIICRPLKGPYGIDVFSSYTKSWTRTYVDGTRGDPRVSKVFWNGAVHWLSETNTHLQFDVDEMKLIESLAPEAPKNCNRHLRDSSDVLLLVEYTPDHQTEWFKIHEMTRGTRRWRLKKLVNIRIADIDPMSGKVFCVLTVLKEPCGDDFELVFVAAQKKVFSYNTKSKAITWIYECEHSTPTPSITAGHYIESLCPV